MTQIFTLVLVLMLILLQQAYLQTDVTCCGGLEGGERGASPKPDRWEDSLVDLIEGGLLFE